MSMEEIPVTVSGRALNELDEVADALGLKSRQQAAEHLLARALEQYRLMGVAGISGNPRHRVRIGYAIDPVTGEGNRERDKYRFDQLREVGDSVDISPATQDGAALHTVRSSAHSYATRRGFKFATRKLPDGSIRVTRKR